MAMKLVRKKAPRGALVRWLASDEELAVKNFFGHKTVHNAHDRKLAETVILEMRQKDVWLQCSCVPGDTPALNSAGLMQESQILFLKGFSHPHHISCPMYRQFKDDDDITTSGTRKHSTSTRIDYKSFLPDDESEARIRAPVKPGEHSNDRTRRKKRSRIARLLLSLIEDAGLNKVESLYPLPYRNVRDSLDSLIAVTQAQEFARGRKLSEVVRFQPGMSDHAQEKLMLELERPDTNWPARKARVFYQIFMSEKVNRQAATFSWNGGDIDFSPERGVSINGESQEGHRPPYWVILAFRRDRDGKIFCSEGYAHALFERKLPVPVDSELERKTLRSISTVAKWLTTKPEAPDINLYKPLFDIEVEVDDEKGYVLPDFIVNATTSDSRCHTIVVETMGYTDDEYCERKSEQHVGMRKIGKLQTDPPEWLKEGSKPFPNHFFGILLHLDS